MRFANSVSALQVNPSFEGVVGRAINGGVKVRTNQIGPERAPILTRLFRPACCMVR